MTAKTAGEQPSHPRKRYVKRTLIALGKRVRVTTPNPPHTAFKLTPRIKKHEFRQAVSGTWRLVVDSCTFIGQHAKLLALLGLLYGFVAYVLIGGVSQFDYATFKDISQQTLNNNPSDFSTALAGFGVAVSGALAQPKSDVQQFLSAILSLLFWLVALWAVRMLSADKAIKLRDALYNGTAPFISMLVILGVMLVQSLPGTLGILAYALAVAGHWLNGGVETMLFVVAALLLSVLSLYWLTSSFIALMIVTLPGMYPWRALVTANQLVLGRRWQIAFRIVAMIALLLIIWAIVLIPLLMLDGWLRFNWLPLVPVAVQLLGAFSFIFSSVYIYKLYRSLL